MFASLQEAAPLFTAVGIGVAAASLLANMLQARRQNHFERVGKQAATLQLFNRRYQDMAVGRRRLLELGAEAPAADVRDYYATYWAIQVDMWEHFRLGVLSSFTYATWLMYAFDIARGGPEVHPFGSREQWIAVGRSMARNNVELALLLNELFDLAVHHAGEVSDHGSAKDMRFRAALKKRLEQLANDALRGRLRVPKTENEARL